MFLLLLSVACNQPAPAPTVAPAPKASTVLVINNSDRPWQKVGVFVDGRPACNVDALPSGGSVTVVDGRCEVNGAQAPQEASTPAPQPVPGKAPASTGHKGLKASASVSGGIGPARAVRVLNNNDFDWHDCTFTLNGKWRHHQAILKAHDADVTPVMKYKDADGSFMTRNVQVHSVGIRCKEGATTVRP